MADGFNSAFKGLTVTGTNLIQSDNCGTIIKHEIVIQCHTCPQNYVRFDMIT
jgi:hypothetical protein